MQNTAMLTQCIDRMQLMQEQGQSETTLNRPIEV